MTSDVGTLVWIAPEILMRECYDAKVDVYSFGMVLYELACRQPPFEDLDACSFEQAVSHGDRPDMEIVPGDCPEEIVT
eukprot:CAMPEP_0176166706 /NCGR_PEP_ID=MMETSP0120_2-20121206/85269_1 /TAXON_ID=160619 /ORGANISM="Kryptoperidinium foliaceum, Strain CCMP 1326" /LENGTH=77 /DNA_ID=CAMNT_0017504271 /DNA_START=9 /DNA_END=239 /DNA_ORIENTATION=+